ETWRGGGWHIEFGLLPAAVRSADHEMDPQAKASAALARARATVLKRLAEAGDDDWHNLPALIDEIRDRDFQFLIPRPGTPQQLYYRSPYDPGLNPYNVAFGSIYGNLDSN